MDPVSHAIVGRLLIGVVDKSGWAGRGAGVAAVLGALSPDLDAVLMPFGWDLYLRVHQVGTHALVGTVACAALVATVVRVCTRGSRPSTSLRATLSRLRGRWGRLAFAAWVGALSHVGLDIASGATVRVLWPVADTVTRFGLIAMAEPSVVLILAVAALVFWRWPTRRVNAALTSLAFVVVVLAGKAAVRAEAQRLYESTTRRDVVLGQMLDAEWGAFSQWVAIDRTADRVRRWRVDTARSTVARELDLPLATATGPQAISLRAPVVQNFLAAHDFPIAVATGEAPAVEIRWSDLQYCWAIGAPGAVRAGVGSLVRPADVPIACGLWFGVAFDAQGAIVRQFVTIGEWLQRR